MLNTIIPLPSEVFPEIGLSKVCPRCKIDKPFSDYYRDKSRKNGYGVYCRICQLDWAANYRHGPNREVCLAKYRLRDTPERNRKTRLKRKYGLSVERFDEMRERQNNKCAMCLSSFTSTDVPNVDHDHSSNKVRALLCSGCNKGLGFFKEDVKVFNTAVKYLDWFNNGTQ